MIKELIPTKVYITTRKWNDETKKYDGEPYKNGSARITLVVKDKSGQEQKISGFGQVSDAPQENTPITVDLYEEEYNGQKQWKFKFLSAYDVLAPKIANLEKRLFAVEVKVNIG